MSKALPLSGRRLLAVFAHPDDEAFSAAGTIATCTRMGAAATVVSMTRGEGGWVRGHREQRPTGEELGRLRSAELAASCAAVGASPPRILDLPDGGLDAVDSRRAAAGLGRILTDVTPDLVITLGNDGAYGHRDHLAVTTLLDLAISGLESEHRPSVLHAAFPKGLFTPVWSALRRVPGVISPGVTGEGLGIHLHQADLVVDLRSCREQKLTSIASHHSQLMNGDPYSFLQPGLITDLLGSEWFTLHSGPSSAAKAELSLEGFFRV